MKTSSAARRLLYIFCGLLAWCSAALPAAERPNFVVFIADDLGSLDCSPYGSPDVRSPSMQRLANRGLLFTSAYVASPSCAPSRAALLTGLMPARNGAEANHSRPKPEIKKLPAYLQELGYEVASFGKVAHYGHGPEYGFDIVGGEGFQRHEGISLAVELLKTRSRNKPLCLFVGTHWPHVPWPAESTYDSTSIKLPPTHIDTPQMRLSRTRYYEAVNNADAHLSTILAAASEHLPADQTYFFFTSDHGAQLPFGKWNVYEAGLRVPLLVTGAGIKPGSRTDAMTSWIDLLPTLVDLAGGTPPAGIDGRSFAPVLRGEKTAHRQQVFATHSGDRDFNVYPMRSLREGGWKYIRNLHPEFQYATHINRGGERDGRDYFASWEKAAQSDPQAAAIVRRYKERPAEELYDLTADPLEQKNLAGQPDQAERLAAMRGSLTDWMQEQGDQQTVFGKPLLLNEPATAIPTAAAKGKAEKGKKAQ